MKVYRIEQYELHAMTYFVRATSAAEAIHKLWQTGGDGADVICSDNGSEYLETDESRGMPTDDNRRLAQALRKLGDTVEDSHIPSIRAIAEADPDEYDEDLFSDPSERAPCL